MSFSSLPPELVHQIIESTVPHTFHSTTYRDRQQNLRHLSLVSRLFRSIAQPFLFKIVKWRRLDYARKLAGTRSSQGGASGSITLRWMIIDGDTWPWAAELWTTTICSSPSSHLPSTLASGSESSPGNSLPKPARSHALYSLPRTIHRPCRSRNCPESSKLCTPEL
ncbi:hypothetical protein JCM5350_002323 [Sporobolomyces pararoseus]